MFTFQQHNDPNNTAKATIEAGGCSKEKCTEIQGGANTFPRSFKVDWIFTYVIIGLPNVIIPHRDV